MTFDDINIETHLVGRAEWVTLTGLHLPPMMARIDTGAKTSSLHAYDIEPFEKDGEKWVSFNTHPKVLDTQSIIQCRCKVVGTRTVKSSNGSKEDRYVIETETRVGAHLEAVQYTLSNRKPMHFRVLFGRQALNKFGFIVDSRKRTIMGDYALRQKIADEE